jgi:hypothetical protein
MATFSIPWPSKIYPPWDFWYMKINHLATLFATHTLRQLLQKTRKISEPLIYGHEEKPGQFCASFVATRVARWFLFKPKKLVNFKGPCN